MNTEKIAALLRQLADALEDQPLAEASAPVQIAPAKDYTLDDCKALINKIVVSDESNREVIKNIIKQYAPTLPQCNQLQLNAIADELEKLV